MNTTKQKTKINPAIDVHVLAVEKGRQKSREEQRFDAHARQIVLLLARVSALEAIEAARTAAETVA